MTAAPAVMSAVGEILQRLKRTVDQLRDRFVRRALDTRERDNAGGHQRSLSTRADIAADDGVYTTGQQPQSNLLMGRTLDVTDLRIGDDIIRDRINLELRRLAEVLKNLFAVHRHSYHRVHIHTFSLRDSMNPHSTRTESGSRPRDVAQPKKSSPTTTPFTVYFTVFPVVESGSESFPFTTPVFAV